MSETEVEDILSLDDAVLREAFKHQLPPIICIPAYLWVRLRHDLGSYLVERDSDNTRVVYWYHRVFIEAAEQIYLLDETFCCEIHSAMADYLLGSWAGGKSKEVELPEKFTKQQVRSLV